MYDGLCAAQIPSAFSSSCLSLSRFNSGLTMQEVTHIPNYISFLLPYDIVSRPLMEQKLVTSMPPLKQSFPAIQDIKQSFPAAYCIYLVLRMSFRFRLNSIGCIIRHRADVRGWRRIAMEIIAVSLFSGLSHLRYY
jgi:hypothetical protein